MANFVRKFRQIDSVNYVSILQIDFYQAVSPSRHVGLLCWNTDKQLWESDSGLFSPLFMAREILLEWWTSTYHSSTLSPLSPPSCSCILIPSGLPSTCTESLRRVLQTKINLSLRPQDSNIKHHAMSYLADIMLVIILVIVSLVVDSKSLTNWSRRSKQSSRSRISHLKKQVKPGFTNYQPRGLADQIKFEV